MHQWVVWLNTFLFLTIVVKFTFDKFLNGLDFEDIWW